MNMQNVSNLVIPEGDVRTIHDKDGRLLWGRLNYDVKYNGDTTQQTYSGKNKWNPQVYASGNKFYTPTIGSTITNTLSAAVTSVFSNPTISVSTTETSGGALYISPQLSPGQYHVSTTVTAGTNNNARIRANILDSNHVVLRNDDYYTIQTDSSRDISFNVTLASGETYITITLVVPTSGGGTLTATNPQIEAGSATTTYEQYVSSPNPSSPQSINVVTGAQAITLSDSNDSGLHTVALGTVELCKLDNYQDYLYKSGDDWYVHKAVEKLVLTGSASENWGVGNSSGSPDCVYCASAVIDNLSESAVRQDFAKCDYFSNAGKLVVSSLTDNISEFTIGTGSSRLRFLVRKEIATNKATWDAWLASNTPVVYYALATPTDTKITDQTLIDQLDAVHQFLTRYGYSATVSGNLPLIIDKTNL